MSGWRPSSLAHPYVVEGFPALQLGWSKLRSKWLTLMEWRWERFKCLEASLCFSAQRSSLWSLASLMVNSRTKDEEKKNQHQSVITQQWCLLYSLSLFVSLFYFRTEQTVQRPWVDCTVYESTFLLKLKLCAPQHLVRRVHCIMEKPTYVDVWINIIIIGLRHWHIWIKVVLDEEKNILGSDPK